MTYIDGCVYISGSAGAAVIADSIVEMGVY